ncbi:MAG: DnaJ domain-containing protein [Elusimicrobiales bacterium]|nr:DnaJ domain-containing protein [Elusimicrobiales bacterium]
MPKFLDYYAILAVANSSNPDEIKSAYHKLAQKHHPDHNPGDPAAEEKFKDINEAYAVLSSASKRQTYDRLWTNLRQGHKFAAAPGARRNNTFSDFFHALFGDGPAGSHGAERGAGPAAAPRGPAPSCSADLTFEVYLSLAEALNGGRHVLSVCCKVPCPECEGAGLVKEGPCLECEASGLVVEVKKVDIVLPQGLRDGDRLALNGLDCAPAYGSGAGRSLRVHVAAHPEFRTAGDDLETRLWVGALAAELGGEVMVPALDGPLKLKLPRNCRSGAVLRVPGRGLRNKAGRRGDLRVVVVIHGESSSLPPEGRPRSGRWS